MAVKSVLAGAQLDQETATQLDEVFDPNGTFGKPFKGVETSYQLLKYCKESLGFVVS